MNLFPWFEKMMQYLGISLALFVVLYGFYWLIFFVVVKLRGIPESEMVQKKRQTLHFPMLFLALVVALSLPQVFFPLPGDFEPLINHVLKVLFILTSTWTLIEASGLLKFVVLKNYDLSQKDNLSARKVYTQFRIIERVITMIILIVSISLILMTFDSIRKIGVSLIASAGVAGIILGLAAQKLIATVIAGVQIAITQPIRIEDAVLVEGEWGWIEEVNLTYVVIRLWDKRRLVLPTNYFIEKPFQNWTRSTAAIIGTVFIHVDYRMPMDPLREELQRILSETDLWDGETQVVQVTDATPQTVEVRMLVSAEDSPKTWDLRVLVREKIIAFVQREYPDYLPRTRVMMDGNSSEGSKAVE